MKTKLIATLTLCLITFATMAETPLWMRYPAISPDGKTIAFTYKGDIYTVQSTGGTAQQLTTNPAYDFMPVWSPDGKQIAFSSDRYSNFDIFIMPSEGGAPTRLTFHSNSEYPSGFSPDGKNILFTAHIEDSPENAQFPTSTLTELYSVPAVGGRITQILTTPAENAHYSFDGTKIIYQDVKGYENKWRKHHTSSVTRDIWIYDTKTGKQSKITNFIGEDRDPVFSKTEGDFFYLSEKNGSFNVFETSLSGDAEAKQLSFHKSNPVRFLTSSNNDLLCYGYNGEIYTLKAGTEPQKVNITINSDDIEPPVEYSDISSQATELAISPSDKEVALVIRGDIYVTSVDYSTTKRITNTPEQERSVSFSPDGRTLLYAGERNNSWNIYKTTIVSKDEPLFVASTLLKEEPVVETAEETFQPQFSPDGKEVAFLENRTTLRAINLESKKVRTILDGSYNYSYNDGDQYYDWSPDGKWFLVKFFEKGRWSSTDAGLVAADGSGKITNLTHSGYSDESPKWVLGGKAMIWSSDREGLRSHGSWGSQNDVYIMFFTQQAMDEFKLNKEEYELFKEKQKKEKEKADKDKQDKEKTKKGDKSSKSKVEENKKSDFEPVVVEFNGLDDRIQRLTINSADISDAVLSPDGDKLYYLARFEDGFDLWVNNLREGETKLLAKVKGHNSNLTIDKEGKTLFFLSDRKIDKVEIATGKVTPIAFHAEQELKPAEERAYLFEHIWRQVKDKFYDPKLHGVDWLSYKENYQRFLPFINNNYDFAEMVSEMLGELNGSHTGCMYRPSHENAESTASLGAFFDQNYAGDGLKVTEVIEEGPLTKSDTKIKPGVIIEKIDGVAIKAGEDYFALLNRKAGDNMLLSLYNPAGGTRWEEKIKPISLRQENELLYKRWVKMRVADVERLSNGRLGYVHVRDMNSESFRKVYSDIFGKFNNKEALIVDTRFNGGGWLHDDLATLLSGRRYADFVPRGQYIGSEPINKWYKPSAVLVSEGNYSDAHGFPFTYKALNIGKLVGMPVPGTLTAVWWENLQDPTLVFGIPQMGIKDMAGNYLENNQLLPDILVPNLPDDVANGIDSQLKAAVDELLKEIDLDKKK
ncbi:MAG TPA: S41 family peptidase [Williamwhitmania sp.]|nr:S41 family peptidase [Williamwhitmania sp.]